MLWGRNRQLILVALVAFGLLGLLMFSARERANISFVERHISGAAAPLQRAVAAAVDFGRRTTRFFVELRHLSRDNERLRAEIATLQFQNANLLENKAEAERLRELLAYRDERPLLPLTLARVVSRGLVAWHSEVIIDRGSRHGITRDDPVVTPSGAVGRIIEVTESTSTVLLITDPRSGIAAMVQASRLVAIAEGDPSARGMVRMPRLPRDFAINEGDVIVTSGIGAIFPRDQVFVIGHVQEIFVSADGLLKFARIVPAVNLDRLEEVFVLRRGAP